LCEDNARILAAIAEASREPISLGAAGINKARWPLLSQEIIGTWKFTMYGRLILIAGVFALTAGCVGYDQSGYAASSPYYAPAPYGAPAPYYYAPTPAYRYGPSLGLGFSFGGGDGWHHHGWRHHHHGWHHHRWR
jgi:hypothetical protein